MAVANFFKLIVLVMIPAFLAGLVTLIYLPSYKKKINARLGNFGSDIKDQKPVTPPAKVFLVTFLAGFLAMILIIAILISMYTSQKRANVTTLGSVDEPSCWIQEVVTESLLDGYSPGAELPGYRLTSSKQENGFEIYFYAGNGGGMGGFPDGLLGIKYTGDSEAFCLEIKEEQKDAIYPDYEGEFISPTAEAREMWLTVDTFNFFGTMDISVEPLTTKPDAEAYMTFEDLRALGTGAKTTMHLELDKELGVEGWYDKAEE